MDLSAKDHTQDFFIPGLTPAVWARLTVGVLLLWSATGWAWWNIKHHHDPHDNLAVNRSEVASKLDGTIITCSAAASARPRSASAASKSSARTGSIRRLVQSLASAGAGTSLPPCTCSYKSNLQQGDPPFADASPEEAWLRRNTRYLLESVKVAALGGLSLLNGMLVNLFLVASVMAFIAWWSGWFYLVSAGSLTGTRHRHPRSTTIRRGPQSHGQYGWLPPA